MNSRNIQARCPSAPVRWRNDESDDVDGILMLCVRTMQYHGKEVEEGG